MEASDQFHATAALLPRVKRPHYPQRWWRQKDPSPYRETNPGRSARTLATVLKVRCSTLETLNSITSEVCSRRR